MGKEKGKEKGKGDWIKGKFRGFYTFKKICEAMRKIGWIILLFVGLPAYAQQNFASISFGASIPLDDYAETGDLASNGYARTGGAIKFDAAYFPGSYLGIGGSFGFRFQLCYQGLTSQGYGHLYRRKCILYHRYSTWRN